MTKDNHRTEEEPSVSTFQRYTFPLTTEQYQWHAEIAQAVMSSPRIAGNLMISIDTSAIVVSCESTEPALVIENVVQACIAEVTRTNDTPLLRTTPQRASRATHVFDGLASAPQFYKPWMYPA